MKSGAANFVKISLLLAVILDLCACGGGGDGNAASSSASSADSSSSSSASSSVSSSSSSSSSIALLPAVTPVGTPLQEAITTTIGAAGGTLTSIDGVLKISVPAGAFASDTEVGIQLISNNAPGGMSSAFRLTPEGTQFAMPVTLTFNVSDDDLSGTTLDDLNVASQDADGHWDVANVTRDAMANTLTVNAAHFSDWSRITGLQLRPPSAVVAVSQGVTLSIKNCQHVDVGDDLVSLLASCDGDGSSPQTPASSLTWQVNGIRNGSAAIGTLLPAGTNATYTAPAQKPSSNPVDISVTYSTQSGGKRLLHSAVTVVGAGLHGTVGWYLDGDTSNTAGNSMSSTHESYQDWGTGSAAFYSGGDVGGSLYYASVKSAYTYYYKQTNLSNIPLAGGCTSMYKQSITTYMHGSSSDPTGLTAILLNDGSGTLKLTFQTPYGTIDGNKTIQGSGSVSGGAGCPPPSPPQNDDPISQTSQLPADVLTFPIGSADQTTFNGTATAHFDGTPPRNYTITYSLQR